MLFSLPGTPFPPAHPSEISATVISPGPPRVGPGPLHQPPQGHVPLYTPVTQFLGGCLDVISFPSVFLTRLYTP